MKIKTDKRDDCLVLGVPRKNTDEFEDYMDKSDVFWKDCGDDEKYLWYEVDVTAEPLIKKWNEKV